MKILFSVFTLTLLSLFLSCNSSDPSNSRAYVTGKITGNVPDYNSVNVKIISDNILVATTFAESSGNFVLSGPLPNQSFSLVLNRKIKSIDTSLNGCEISADRLQIKIPTGTTYITFNEINVE